MQLYEGENTFYSIRKNLAMAKVLCILQEHISHGRKFLAICKNKFPMGESSL